MGNNALVIVKKVFVFILIISLLFLSALFLRNLLDNKLIDNVKEFVQTDTKIIYITNEDYYSSIPIDYFKKYDIDYMYINSDNLSIIEKNKLKKIINNKYLTNIIEIYENGKIKDTLIEFENKDSLISFLTNNEVIPEIIGDNSNIISDVKDLINTDYSIIYLPYYNLEEIEEQDDIIKEISSDYSIDYKKIDAYLLSKNQKNKLNSLLQISDVKDQILIIVKNNKIIGCIRGIFTKKKILNELNNYNFINYNTDYINYIDYNMFETIISTKNKSLITIGTNECNYCQDLIDLFNNMAEENSIQFNYINVENLDSEDSVNVQEKLKNIGYNNGFSMPLTLIVENNKIIDYVIGLSSEKYFLDIFKENGIIN